MITVEQEYDLPYLYREARKIDYEKAVEIGVAYMQLETNFKEACEQFREIIET